MELELERDNDNHNNWLNNIWEWLNDTLIIKEYIINENDTYYEQFKSGLLRYRRIIGIIALCILIYIGIYCGDSSDSGRDRNSNTQRGGAGEDPFAGMQVDALTQGFKKTKFDEIGKYKQELEMEDKKAAVKQAHEAQKAKAAQIQAKAAKAKAEGEAKAQKESRLAELKGKKKRGRTKEETKEYLGLKKDMGIVKKPGILSRASSKIGSFTGSVSKTISNSTVGAAARSMQSRGMGAKMAALDKGGKTFSEMRKEGMASGNMIGRAGYAVAGQMKEYAGWFYQILYGIAIAIAICMIVLPSISFFIVGLICYFLLKYKIARMKAL